MLIIFFHLLLSYYKKSKNKNNKLNWLKNNNFNWARRHLSGFHKKNEYLRFSALFQIQNFSIQIIIKV